MVSRIRNTGLFLLILWLPLAALAASVEAHLDRTRISEDETVTLTLRASGDTGGQPDLSPLERDFEILSRSQSMRFEFINGRSARHSEWQFVLAPRHSGRITIPPIAVGDEYSPAIRLEVVAGRAPAQARQAERFRLELLAEPEHPWVGQQVLVTLRLYYRVDFDKGEIGEPEIREGKGELRPLGKERRYRKQIGGDSWLVYERRYLLIPDQPGRLVLEPVDFKAIRYPGGGGLFAPPVPPRTVRLRSAPVALEVRPAPPHHGEWLPARSVELEQQWEGLDHARAGEPITRRVTLRVDGQPADRLPELLTGTPPATRAYPDKPQTEEQETEEGIVSLRREQVTYIPQQGGEIHFPPLRIHWWNTRTGKEEVATVPGRTVRVAGAPAAATAPPAPANTGAPHPAPSGSSAPAADGNAAAARVTAGTGLPWPWIALGLAVGWGLTLLWFLRRRGATPRPERTRHAGNHATGKTESALREACRKRDWHALRNALMDWARARWPDDPPHDLYALGQRCGEPLAGLIEEINRIQGLRERKEWPCRALQDALHALQRDQAGKAKALPPLYPDDNAGSGKAAP